MGRFIGCNVVFNLTNTPYNIRVLEVPTRTLAIGAGTELSFGGVSFSWAADRNEISARAFLFYMGALTGGTPVFYMFHRKPGEFVYWAPYNNGHPSFETSTYGGAGLANHVDVVIQANDTPRAVYVD